MKKFTILLLTLSFSISTFAQVTIKGTVISDSIPLESASVIIKNSTKGVATNENGEFIIETKKGDTLSVSYLGYETKEITVNKNEDLKINLEVGSNLEEVIVIAYATTSIYCKLGCGSRIRGCGASCEGVVVKELVSDHNKPKLYPNPSSSGIFQLKLNEDYNEVKISVANISGQTILNTKHQKFGEKLTIDLSEFSTGIYIINVIADGQYLEAFKAIRS